VLEYEFYCVKLIFFILLYNKKYKNLFIINLISNNKILKNKKYYYPTILYVSEY
jgi:hypothetical protein